MLDKIRKKLDAGQEVINSLAWNKQYSYGAIKEAQEHINSGDFENYSEEYYLGAIEYNQLIINYIEKVEEMICDDIKGTK